MRISKELIIAAYEVAKEYYNRQLSRQDAIEKLSRLGMNPGSAFINIQVFKHLLDGEKFTRTLSAESFEYFLGRILSDYGKEQLLISLDSLSKHIEYLEQKRDYAMGLVGEIYRSYLQIATNTILQQPTGDIDELSFPEGRERYRLHKFKERNRELIRLAKEYHKQNDPSMSCQVCNFSFSEIYGDLGADFIEAHHIFPISELKVETPTRIEDFAMVCSNCHRMLHRKRPWLEIDNLRSLISSKDRFRHRNYIQKHDK